MQIWISANLANLHADILISALIGLFSLGLSLLVGVQTEKLAGRGVGYARPRASEAMWLNIRYGVVMVALTAALQPLLLDIPLAMTRTLGAGWITFRIGAAGWCCAFLAVLFMTDLLEYLFHRAQHRFLILWRMHELHHSAEHFDVTLTYRNFWVEPLIKSACVYPLIGVVFKVPAGVGSAVGLLFLVNNHFVHMNLRVSLQRFALLVNHPQYHRLHHSRHARDYNKNFSAMLPLWDWLFGTLCLPACDQYPDVGLESGEAPRSLSQALMWPLRRRQQVGEAVRGHSVQSRT